MREPLDIIGRAARAPNASRVPSMLDRVGLRAEFAERYPHELSGGQKQRVNIARVLTLRPKLMVCDEVVAALDVSIQADMLNLFADLQREFGLTYLFITHDLGVVSISATASPSCISASSWSSARPTTIAERPLHPYTEALLSAEPEPAAVASAHRRAHRAAGRDPEPDLAAFRLPLPHALPLRPGALRHDRARVARARAGPFRRLPLRGPSHDKREETIMTTRRNVLAGAMALAATRQAWAQKKGGVLKVSAPTNPSSLDPTTGGSGQDHSFLYPMFDTLVAFEWPTLKAVPGLAELWKWADPRTLVLNIRSGVSSTTARRSTRRR